MNPMRYAEVVVHEPKVQGVFHYHIPPTLEGRVQPGMIVVVPFGRRMVYGVVLRLLEQPAVPETRPIEALADERWTLTPAQIQLAQQMAEATLAPLSSCMALMFPPRVLQTADTLYTLTPEAPSAEAEAARDLTPTARALLALLQRRGPLRGRQIGQALPRRNWRQAATLLRRRGWLRSEAVLPRPHTSRKTVAMADLAIAPEEARNLPLARLSKREDVARRRQQVLQALAQQRPRAVARLLAETGARRHDLQALAKQGLVRLYRQQQVRDPLAHLVAPSPPAPPALTPAQAEAWVVVRERVRQAIQGQTPQAVLLHGVTGSGKTEIYLRATAEALRGGGQALILVPEIALTPQTVQRFRTRFAGRVGVLHSNLSEGERLDTWLRVRSGEIEVLIGARSALFAPFSRLRLIVVDECHEEAYYENERQPHYHARQLALLYGQIAPAAVLLGSATPEVATFAQARRGRLTLLSLPTRILAHQNSLRARPAAAPRFRPAGGDALAADLPPVQVVDMRAELRSGHTGIFSRPLLQGLETVLQRQEQAILFLNRRGSAPYVFCRDCGHVMRCPRCDIPLTYHQSERQLVCHHCGYRRGLPNRCPVCGGERLRPYGAGTERVEAEVHRLFPQARTLRWDADTTRTRGGHQAILEQFAAHRADVLIGTQMLAKGLDLPLVTLVGIVLADVGLTLPDYRAAERGFQLLTQVAGRAGRSPLGGRVVLQTYMPNHYAIRAAARHDFLGFYRQELVYRRRLGYPPYAQLVRLRLRGWKAERLEEEARRLAAQIRQWLDTGQHAATQIIGPAPCFFAREGGRFCWHLILRGPEPAAVLRGRRLAPWDIAINPPSLL